jgi:hypothetical protein
MSSPTLPIIPGELHIDPADPEVQRILGTVCFIAGPIAHIFQKAGYPIPTHAEEEQAHILLWMLALYQKYGAQEWRAKGDEELRGIVASIAEQKS